jgi:hypothetical protein
MPQLKIDFTGTPTSGEEPLTVSFTSSVQVIPDKTLFLPIESVSQEEFASIRMRGITNGYPTKILDNGGFPNRSLMFWPIPSDGTIGVELWLWEPLVIYDLDAELNLPKGYERYFIYALAAELCDTFGAQPTREILTSLVEAEAAIKTLNQVEFIAQPSNAAVGLSRLGRPYNYIDFISGAAMLPRQRS